MKFGRICGTKLEPIVLKDCEYNLFRDGNFNSQEHEYAECLILQTL